MGHLSPDEREDEGKNHNERELHGRDGPLLPARVYPPKHTDRMKSTACADKATNNRNLTQKNKI